MLRLEEDDLLAGGERDLLDEQPAHLGAGVETGRWHVTDEVDEEQIPVAVEIDDALGAERDGHRGVGLRAGPAQQDQEQQQGELIFFHGHPLLGFS